MNNVTIKNLRIPIERICNQTTYLQMNDTHTTHWSVQCSAYMGTSYMCIKVVFEVFYNVKEICLSKIFDQLLDKFKGQKLLF